jgi:hypothetical protein
VLIFSVTSGRHVRLVLVHFEVITFAATCWCKNDTLIIPVPSPPISAMRLKIAPEEIFLKSNTNMRFRLGLNDLTPVLFITTSKAAVYSA